MNTVISRCAASTSAAPNSIRHLNASVLEIRRAFRSGVVKLSFCYFRRYRLLTGHGPEGRALRPLLTRFLFPCVQTIASP